MRGPLQKTVDEDLTGWGSVPSVDGTTTSTPATQAAQAETAIEQSIASVSVTPPPPHWGSTGGRAGLRNSDLRNMANKASDRQFWDLG